MEKDNKGNDCQVFDVVVNEQYLDKVTKENATYQIGFVVSVALQGLEQKYELDLDRNWIMLKNRKVCFLCEFIFVVQFDIVNLLGSSGFATFHRVHLVDNGSGEGL